MNKQGKWILMSVALLSLGLTLYSAEMQSENRAFSGKKSVRLELVSGDCRIKTVGGDRIEVKLSFSYDRKSFTPKFEEQGEILVLGEDFDGNSCQGESIWEISLPASTGIEFRSASGNLVISGVQNGIEAHSVSGNIELREIGGPVSLHTASGNISLKDIGGDINARSASGDIDIEQVNAKLVCCKTASGNIGLNKVKAGLKIAGASGNISAQAVSPESESSFKTASGNVAVQLASALKADITLASASGDACLDFNGQPMDGSFELTARKGRPILSPFKFDREEEFEQNDQTYVKKTKVQKSASPKITVKTASGKAEVK